MHLTGSLRGSTSVKTPVINIEGTNIPFYNYAYIDEFDRYYYITDVKSVRNNIWEVSFLCDVLMSFKNDILNAHALVDNSQDKKTTNYLASDIWSTLVKDKTDIINFSGSGLLDSGEYILITAGG